MRKLILEAPCFGFGPISTSISFAKNMQQNYEVMFLTYGEALDFLKKSTDFKYFEIDTRIEENFKKASEIFNNKDDIFIVNTNFEFATYLIKNNFNVISIDTLYWMWNKVDETYKTYPYIISQVYYGRNIGELPSKPECKPIINYDLWTNIYKDNNDSVLISFGGMSEPGSNSFVIKNANLMIEEIKKNLPKTIRKINIIGGLFDKNHYFEDGREINVLGLVGAKDFYKVMTESKYVFLSPGLTCLYETLLSEKPFCLLPGLNVSQIYQVYDFNKICNYKYCILWPDSQSLIEQFDRLPELDGLKLLENYLSCENKILKTDFKNVILDFVKNVDENKWVIDKKLKENIFNRENVEDLVCKMLLEMEKNL